MRRFLTLVFLLCLALPAGITFSGCYRNPAGNYCNGLGYGLKNTDVYAITLQPETTGLSMAFGQTRQISAPSAVTCKNSAASVSGYTYGTSNNKLVDISPSGSMCAGTWNRNSGGGIADYTICQYPSPLPDTGGLPYSVAYITASANSVTSNPVAVYVHTQVSSISLVGPQQCLSQGQLANLDAQACYSSNGKQVLLCAPSSVSSTNYACPLPSGATTVPNCSSAIGTLTYTPGTGAVATINPITNQITAEQPGTTVITASIAGSGSAAGYFSTCPPKSISITLNGATSGTVTQGVQQNLVTNVIDTAGNPITGLVLDYQSTNPLDITAGSTGGITASFPGDHLGLRHLPAGDVQSRPHQPGGTYGTGLADFQQSRHHHYARHGQFLYLVFGPGPFAVLCASRIAERHRGFHCAPALCAQFHDHGSHRRQPLLRLLPRADDLQHDQQHASPSRSRRFPAWCWRWRPTIPRCSSTTRFARCSISTIPAAPYHPRLAGWELPRNGRRIPRPCT